MHMLEVRPCGVCVAYVPYDTGCQHWRPQIGATAKRRERRRIDESAKRAAIAEFRRQHGLSPLA